MDVEILSVDKRFPNIPIEELKRVLENTTIPVHDIHGQCAGYLSANEVHEDGKVTGTFKIEDEGLKETFERMKDNCLKP